MVEVLRPFQRTRLNPIALIYLLQQKLAIPSIVGLIIQTILFQTFQVEASEIVIIRPFSILIPTLFHSIPMGVLQSTLLLLSTIRILLNPKIQSKMAIPLRPGMKMQISIKRLTLINHGSPMRKRCTPNTMSIPIP